MVAKRMEGVSSANRLTNGTTAGAGAGGERYAVALTPDLARLIDPANPADPIARQFVPDARRARPHPEERADPIGDDAASPVKGVVHRYPDRVLLTPDACVSGLLPLLLPAREVGPGQRR